MASLMRLIGKSERHPNALALNRDRFLELIERRQFGSQIALVAMPLRALIDLVTLRKLQWQGLDGLVEGMRIEEQTLKDLRRTDIEALVGVYKQKRPNTFLMSLARELHLD